MTIEEILTNLPEWVEMLPEDYEGETSRACVWIVVSKQAIDNENFDLIGYLRAKLLGALKTIRKKNGVDVLHLAHRLELVILDLDCKTSGTFQFYIEYEKP